MIREAIEALLAAAEDGVSLDGLEVESAGNGFRFATPESEHQGLSRAELRETASARPGYVSNWYFWAHVAPERPAWWDFLRWLEGAGSGAESDPTAPERIERIETGHTRTWGELAITVTLAGDQYGRSYDLRHREDTDLPAADLETYRDPLDVRDLVRADRRGRYRPLKTAPTLKRGWAFPDLGPEDLPRAIDFAYPATVENWHRELEGELDVSHWRETIDRQTGIYGLVKTWDRGEGHEHVNWVAEACCVDSQCLKRREWEYDDETDLDVPAGEGEFPCREPCSMVIAAARKWTKIEGEASRTYEFDLTPSEKAQLDAIVAAVSEGRIEEIPEADFDDPANRYRARFLRAKRFEDGEFPERESAAPLAEQPSHEDDDGAS